MDLPSSRRPIWLVLQVRHFRCSNCACPRKTFAEPLADLLLPRAQRTSRLRESLRELGEEGGGQAGARMSKQQGMACSASTVLRLLRHSSLPASPPVKVLGVDDWAWRQQSRAMERYSSISSVISRSICCQMPRQTLLPPGSKSILRWSSSVGTVARPRPSGPRVEHRRRFRSLIAWGSGHIIHNLGEALEKVLARHHTDVKRAATPSEEEHQVIAALDQQALAHVMARSQAEQLRQARRERRLATFTRVHELSATSAGVVLRLPGCLGSRTRPP